MMTSRKIRVLVVDDNRLVQRALALPIETLGHDVRVAFDGVQAVTICQQERFDLILMDAMMPEMDGFEASRRIRESEGHARGETRIVMITAMSTQELDKKCAAAGIDSWLSKPVSREDILILLPIGG
jgi:CheY-like chemotaxis protein